MEISQILNQIFPLSDNSRKKLENCIEEIFLPKNHLIINTNKIEHNIYFIKKGIARAYADTPDKEITFWFGKEGDALISINSLIKSEKGYENIELLEDCQLYHLDTHQLHQLFLNDIEIANWGRLLAERELVKTEKRLIDQQFLPAKERYQKLLQENPSLIHRVPLGHIAYYLGITQVSLSRIRAKIKL